MFRARVECFAKKLHTDLIHDHGVWLPSNHSAATVARQLKIPLVISPRGSLGSWSLSQKNTKKRFALWLYQQRDLESAACFSCTSHLEEVELRAMGLRQPIAVIPNGIIPPDNLNIHARTSAPREALFLSRLHVKKGVLPLVRAWAQLRPQNWRLVLAGPAENQYDETVKREIERLGATDIIQLVGSVPEEGKAAYYRRASLFILPSHFENVGIVVAEALSYGIPVITTKETPWEMLSTENCGWHINMNDRELASAIADATGSTPTQLDAMGMRGRAAVISRYGWKAIGEQTLATYEWVLDRSRSAPPWVSVE
jgi:glycosyltransferase involved in cell wall biosynthesis